MRTLLKFFSLAAFTFTATQSHAAPTAQTLLEKRNKEFEQEVIQVAPDVYTAVGFGVSPTSMIVGDSGLVIIDTQIDKPSAEKVMSAFREITDKPVKSIILSHGHGDHTGGIAVFAEEGNDVQIWAREPFNLESTQSSDVGLTIQNQRGALQAGFLLPPEKRINNGVAKVYFPKRGGEVFSTANNEPTQLLKQQRQRVQFDDIEIELVASTGETHDGLYVWYPRSEVVFTGDIFYKSWPNLYAIRGTAYRDVDAWINSLSTLIAENPKHVVPGHTRPIIGREATLTTLTNYRDAIQSIFEQTIAGMNKGLTSDELVQTVQLPQEYQQLDYLREYYGNVEWAVRSIFNGYLGWFDGNATNLFSLSPVEEAKKMAALAGGPKQLLAQAEQSLDESPQWTAQLCDHLLALNYQSSEVKLLKANALDTLGESLITTTGRNYYFSSAQKLREL